MKIAFFQIEDWEIDHIKQQLAGHELFFTKDKLSAESLPEQRDFEVISVFVGSQIDKAVLAALPNL